MVQRTVRPLRYDRFSNSLLEQEKSMKKLLCILLVLMLILIRKQDFYSRITQRLLQ